MPGKWKYLNTTETLQISSTEDSTHVLLGGGVCSKPPLIHKSSSIPSNLLPDAPVCSLNPYRKIMKSNSFTFTGLLLLASASAGPSEADLIAEYDPFATVAAVNASLNECYTNHATVYANKAAPPPSCPFYFERDFTTMYWCRDKSCAISDAIQTHTGNTYPESCDDPDPDFVAPPNDSNFFIDSNFVTRNKDPATIPCGTQLHDQASYGTRCVRGEDWAR